MRWDVTVMIPAGKPDYWQTQREDSMQLLRTRPDDIKKKNQLKWNLWLKMNKKAAEGLSRLCNKWSYGKVIIMCVCFYSSDFHSVVPADISNLKT